MVEKASNIIKSVKEYACNSNAEINNALLTDIVDILIDFNNIIINNDFISDPYLYLDDDGLICMCLEFDYLGIPKIDMCHIDARFVYDINICSNNIKDDDGCEGIKIVITFKSVYK